MHVEGTIHGEISARFKMPFNIGILEEFEEKQIGLLELKQFEDSQSAPPQQTRGGKLHRLWPIPVDPSLCVLSFEMLLEGLWLLRRVSFRMKRVKLLKLCKRWQAASRRRMGLKTCWGVENRVPWVHVVCALWFLHTLSIFELMILSISCHLSRFPWTIWIFPQLSTTQLLRWRLCNLASKVPHRPWRTWLRASWSELRHSGSSGSALGGTACWLFLWGFAWVFSQKGVYQSGWVLNESKVGKLMLGQALWALWERWEATEAAVEKPPASEVGKRENGSKPWTPSRWQDSPYNFLTISKVFEILGSRILTCDLFGLRFWQLLLEWKTNRKLKDWYEDVSKNV